MKKDRGEHSAGAFGRLTASLLLTALSLGLYCLTGVTEFSPQLSLPVLLFSGLSLAAGLALVCPVRRVRRDAWTARLVELALYGVYALTLLAWLFYLVSQIYYITNILVAIDGTKLSPAFIATAALLAAAWVLSLLAALSFGRSLRQRDDGKEAQHA